MKRLLFALTACAALCAQTPKPAAHAPSYLDLKYPPLRQVRIPDIPQFTLPNGIHLYLLENHELPLVSGFALVRTGSLFDPPGKTGLGEIAGNILRTGGTTSKTGDQIDEMLENVAASVESSVGAGNARVGFSCLRENTDEVLAVFKDLLTHPEFRQDKIDLIKGQYRGIIARRNDEASGISSREFSQILYGPDTPYGREMEYADLEAITRDDLLGFYHRYYFPANTIIAVQGDFSAAEMKSRIEALFADWTVKGDPVPPFPDVNAKPAPGVFLATKNDVTQTFFELGHLGGVLKDPNYPALEVMADILGGGFSSRLFKDVRTRQGLAYSISAVWGAGFTQPGTFHISGSTKSASTVAAIKAAEDEINRIRTTEVTDEELKTSKDTVLNSFVFNFDSPSKTLGRVVTYEYNHYPKDFIFQYQKAIEHVTKADVLRVAKQYVHPENLTVVAVGKPAAFGKPLATLGPVKDIDLTIPEPKRAAAKADPGTTAKGKAVLERARQAIGGESKIAAVKDVTQTADAELHMGPNTMKASQQTQIIFPSLFRQTQTLPFGKVVVYSDGQTGWMTGPQGQGALTPPVLKQIQGETLHQILNVLLSDHSSDRIVNGLGDNAVEISDKHGNSVKLEIDPATGLPLREQYDSVSMGSQPMPVTETFSDWRDVAGIRLPFSITIEQDGHKFADVKVQSWSMNSSLKPEDLNRRP